MTISPYEISLPGKKSFPHFKGNTSYNCNKDFYFYTNCFYFLIPKDLFWNTGIAHTVSSSIQGWWRWFVSEGLCQGGAALLWPLPATGRRKGALGAWGWRWWWALALSCFVCPPVQVKALTALSTLYSALGCDCMRNSCILFEEMTLVGYKCLNGDR